MTRDLIEMGVWKIEHTYNKVVTHGIMKNQTNKHTQ